MKTNILITVILIMLISLMVSSCSSSENTIIEGVNIEPESVIDSIVTQPEKVENDDSSELEELVIQGGASVSKTVIIEGMKFNPVDIDIKVGDTIEWVNKDSVKHTVTFEDARFDVQVSAGESVTHTFEEGDLERYFCVFHPGMTGSVQIG